MVLWSWGHFLAMKARGPEREACMVRQPPWHDSVGHAEASLNKDQGNASSRTALNTNSGC